VKVIVFDYGAGNLHSLLKALEDAGVGARVSVEEDPRRAADGDALVLPGVGAFGAAAERLAPGRERIREALVDGLPCLGICLGMQLLFDGSDEGEGAGLGVLAGRVTRLRARHIPQIGWNALSDATDELLRSAPVPYAYFANGFVARPEDTSVVTAWTTHERDTFPAMVRRGAVVGTQFHPEKSSAPGVRLVHAFLKEAAQRVAIAAPASIDVGA
jgi:imidazole glycerol-phosphate synthase subunit HisH